MATGTGKTYTAFQIIHRLWKSNTKKRILFLAERNAFIDQTKCGDFRHFKDKMTVIKQKKIDKSYEIYLALYQGLTNYEQTNSDDNKDAYREFSPDFFDLIVIDECHRGSAAEDSAWREILEYFSSATHIGLTATPKETKTISSTEYFGAPIYTYSLKQGIQDGFLAPYKVLRVDLNVALEGWRPEQGKTDKQGSLVEDRINKWDQADKKHAIIEGLIEQDIIFQDLVEAVNKEMDIFDLVCHTAFDQSLTRSERVNNVKERDYFTKYGEQARKVLEALLDKYANEGIENIEDMKILQVNPLAQFGSPSEILQFFWGKVGYQEALAELEQEIYDGDIGGSYEFKTKYQSKI